MKLSRQNKKFLTDRCLFSVILAEILYAVNGSLAVAYPAAAVMVVVAIRTKHGGTAEIKISFTMARFADATAPAHMAVYLPVAPSTVFLFVVPAATFRLNGIIQSRTGYPHAAVNRGGGNGHARLRVINRLCHTFAQAMAYSAFSSNAWAHGAGDVTHGRAAAHAARSTTAARGACQMVDRRDGSVRILGNEAVTA